MPERVSNTDIRLRIRLCENSLGRGDPHHMALLDLLDARTLNEQLSQGLNAMTTMRDVAERELEEVRKALIWFALEPEIFEGTPNWVQASVIAARAAGKEKRQ